MSSSNYSDLVDSAAAYYLPSAAAQRQHVLKLQPTGEINEAQIQLGTGVLAHELEFAIVFATYQGKVASETRAEFQTALLTSLSILLQDLTKGASADASQPGLMGVLNPFPSVPWELSLARDMLFFALDHLHRCMKAGVIIACLSASSIIHHSPHSFEAVAGAGQEDTFPQNLKSGCAMPAWALIDGLGNVANVQSLPQSARAAYFQLVALVIQVYWNQCAHRQMLGNWISTTDSEKDPRNLLLVFRVWTVLLQKLDLAIIYPHVVDVFESTTCYFPITFSTSKHSSVAISGVELQNSLVQALGACPLLLPYVLPFFLEKGGKESIDALRHCIPSWGVFALLAASTESILYRILLSNRENNMLPLESVEQPLTPEQQQYVDEQVQSAQQDIVDEQHPQYTLLTKSFDLDETPEPTTLKELWTFLKRYVLNSDSTELPKVCALIQAVVATLCPDFLYNNRQEYNLKPVHGAASFVQPLVNAAIDELRVPDAKQALPYFQMVISASKASTTAATCILPLFYQHVHQRLTAHNLHFTAKCALLQLLADVAETIKEVCQNHPAINQNIWDNTLWQTIYRELMVTLGSTEGDVPLSIDCIAGEQVHPLQHLLLALVAVSRRFLGVMLHPLLLHVQCGSLAGDIQDQGAASKVLGAVTHCVRMVKNVLTCPLTCVFLGENVLPLNKLDKSITLCVSLALNLKFSFNVSFIKTNSNNNVPLTPLTTHMPLVLSKEAISALEYLPMTAVHSISALLTDVLARPDLSSLLFKQCLLVARNLPYDAVHDLLLTLLGHLHAHLSNPKQEQLVQTNELILLFSSLLISPHTVSQVLLHRLTCVAMLQLNTVVVAEETQPTKLLSSSCQLFAALASRLDESQTAAFLQVLLDRTVPCILGHNYEQSRVYHMLGQLSDTLAVHCTLGNASKSYTVSMLVLLRAFLTCAKIPNNCVVMSQFTVCVIFATLNTSSSSGSDKMSLLLVLQQLLTLLFQKLPELALLTVKKHEFLALLTEYTDDASLNAFAVLCVTARSLASLDGDHLLHVLMNLIECKFPVDPLLAQRMCVLMSTLHLHEGARLMKTQFHPLHSLDLLLQLPSLQSGGGALLTSLLARLQNWTHPLQPLALGYLVLSTSLDAEATTSSVRNLLLVLRGESPDFATLGVQAQEKLLRSSSQVAPDVHKASVAVLTGDLPLLVKYAQDSETAQYSEHSWTVYELLYQIAEHSSDKSALTTYKSAVQTACAAIANHPQRKMRYIAARAKNAWEALK